MTVSPQGKSLSQRPLGYILAVLGGTLGGPLGWIVSPAVLLVLNNVMREKDGKHPNRFLAWSLIGVIGAPLSLAPIVANSESSKNQVVATPQVSQQASPSASEEPTKQQDASGVNMQNYLKLQNGMTYEQVVEILGKPGEEMSSNELAGYKTVMYMWRATGLGALSGGNMNAMFQNGALVQKSQFNLPQN